MVEAVGWLDDQTDPTIGEALAWAVPFLVVQRGRIMHANPAALALLGYADAPGELLGSFAELLVDVGERPDFRRELRYPTRARPGLGSTRAFATRSGERLVSATIASGLAWNGQKAVGLAFVAFQPGTTDTPSAPAAEARPEATLPNAPVLDVLSPRQSEIAKLLALGFSPVNVAAQLNLSVETARTHIKAIYQKTGCRCRVDLARLVLGADSFENAPR